MKYTSHDVPVHAFSAVEKLVKVVAAPVARLVAPGRDVAALPPLA